MYLLFELLSATAERSAQAIEISTSDGGKCCHSAKFVKWKDDWKSAVGFAFSLFWGKTDRKKTYKEKGYCK